MFFIRSYPGLNFSPSTVVFVMMVGRQRAATQRVLSTLTSVKATPTRVPPTLWFPASTCLVPSPVAPARQVDWDFIHTYKMKFNETSLQFGPVSHKN